MSDNGFTTESTDLKGRWIRYVETDKDTGRDYVAVTQIVSIDVQYRRPREHEGLETSDAIYVEWLMKDNSGAQIAQIDVMTQSPIQVLEEEDPIQMLNVRYSALGKQERVTEFSMATVQEVLVTINKLIRQHPEKASLLTEHYKLVQSKDNWVFRTQTPKTG